MGVCLVGIGETLRRDLAELILRAAEDQVNMECGNIKMCKVLEASL